MPRPDIELGVGSDSHARQTAAMLTGVAAAVVERARRPLVLVYGDTNSTLAGALAAAKLHVPVAHVEAGLRSFDRRMPEEVNRVLTDHLSSLLFCPTDTAVANLAARGHRGRRRADRRRHVRSRHGDAHARSASRAVLERFGVRARRLRAGHGAPAGDHRRPGAPREPCWPRWATLPRPWSSRPTRARRPASSASVSPSCVAPNVRLVAPVGYVESLALAKNARVVATDSGGLQKEAYFFAVPCVTMRDTSEWVETIESGWNVLVGTDREALAAALADPPRGARHPAFYGRGDAGERLAAALADSSNGRLGRRGGTGVEHYDRRPQQRSAMSVPYLEIEAAGVPARSAARSARRRAT